MLAPILPAKAKGSKKIILKNLSFSTHGFLTSISFSLEFQFNSLYMYGPFISSRIQLQEMSSLIHQALVPDACTISLSPVQFLRLNQAVHIRAEQTFCKQLTAAGET